MRKVICTLSLILTINQLFAQGFLNKIKSKISSVTEKATGNASPGQAISTNDIKYTDPATVGTVILTFSKKRIQDSPDGYNMWFSSVKVVNNQLELKIADHGETTYTYSNGQLTNTHEAPDLSLENKLPNGSEQDYLSVDFSQTDATRAMLKTGSHVASGMIPGKPEQTYTFHNKVFGQFASAQIARNADSSVLAVVGVSYSGGIKYHMSTSSGQDLSLPKQYGGTALISPDGKISAALYLVNKEVYTTNGAKYPVGNVLNNQVWLRNSGNVFYIIYNEGNKHSVEKNGSPFFKSNDQINMKQLFISNDEKSYCWEGYRGLYFSDGTIFENASSPSKVILDNKEVIIFLDVEMASGKLYLCRHDL